MDNRFKEFDNCEVVSVWGRKLPNIKHNNEFMVKIAIRKEDTVFPDYVDVVFSGPNLYNELKKLMNKEKERVYAAHGMADIDFFFYPRKNKYCLEWSPNEASYNYFCFTEEEFTKIVDAIAPDEEKEY